MKITGEQLKKEADKVFDKIFSIEDIRKGNTIEMHEEATKIALENLKVQQATGYKGVNE